MHLDEIPHRIERLALAGLFLELASLSRGAARKRHGLRQDGAYVITAVYTASFIGRGIGLNKISQLSGVPRATASRRIRSLISVGVVRRSGNLYWISDDSLKNPVFDVDRGIAAVRRAAVSMQKNIITKS
jgi:hypothetical protein